MRVIKQKFREKSEFSKRKINRSVTGSKSYDFSVVVSNGKQNTTANASQETALAYGKMEGQQIDIPSWAGLVPLILNTTPSSTAVRRGQRSCGLKLRNKGKQHLRALSALPDFYIFPSVIKQRKRKHSLPVL